MLYVGLASCYLGACAEVQMDYNVLTYDSAIADSSNQLLLLNAVRASQHYPRSFTSVGQLLAGPPVSGGLASTLNFNQLAQLLNFNLNPSVAATAGYSSFALGNLNSQDFMIRMRQPVVKEITDAFRKNPNWPRQLLDLLYYQDFKPTLDFVKMIDARRKSICMAPTSSFEYTACELLVHQIDEYTPRCTGHFVDTITRMREFNDDPIMYYNTAVNYCHFERFRIFLEEVKLVQSRQIRAKLFSYPICLQEPKPGCLHADQRSPLDMIGYLGELIAAQNYIDDPFVPKVEFGFSIDSRFRLVDVPFFVVRRGEPLGNAAVVVRHNGVPYYIPRPDFGSLTEERSLQTLELVLQTVQAATQQKDLPSTVQTVAIAKQ
jgi:hypothetical protein